MVRSEAWGGKELPVTRGFGAYDPSWTDIYPGPEYTEPLGFPGGTHVGLDIAMDKGTKLYALNAGVVDYAAPEVAASFRPRPVYIKTKDDPDTVDDEGGYVEIWGHMWTNAVKTGDTVKPGDFLGTSGEQTYRGTMDPDGSGPHLHFELRQPSGDTSSGYRAVDPTAWLQKAGITVSPDNPNTDVDGDGENDVILAPNNPDGSVPKDETGGTGNPILDALGLGTIITTIQDVAKRGVFIVVGLIVLGIGLSSVASGGFGGSGAARKIVKYVPAAKAARKIARAL